MFSHSGRGGGRAGTPTKQLSPCATTAEPTHRQPVVHNRISHCDETPVHRNKERPLLTATKESPRVATKTQCGQKEINF